MDCTAQVKQRRAWRLNFASALAMAVAALFCLMLAEPPQLAESADSEGLHLIQSDASGVVFELNVSSYQLTQRTLNGVTFDVLRAPNAEASADTPGTPQLPLRGVMLAVPQDAEVSIRIINQQAEEIPQRLNLLPVPTAQVDRKGFGTQDYINTGHAYIADTAVYARDRLEPAAPVRLGTIGFMRSQRFAQISLFPFQYNAAQQHVRWLKHLTVEVRFSYPHGMNTQTLGAVHDEGPFERVLQERLLNYVSAKIWRSLQKPASRVLSAVAASGDFKIAINQTGIYRLAYNALIAAGVPSSGFDPRTFKLKKNGSEISIYVSGESDGAFDPGDYIEFYAQGLNTVYTDVNIYWLSFGGANGLRMATRSVTPAASAALSTFRDRVHVEQNHYYVGDRPTGAGDHWYWNVVGTFPPPNGFFAQTPAIYTFTLTDAGNSLTATLYSSVTGAGASYGAAFPHHEQIYLNGNLVTDSAWGVDDVHQLATPFPESYLISGTNTISLTLPNDTGVGYDALFTNWFEVDYDHLYAARNDYLAFGSDVGGTVQLTVTNFTAGNLALYDVTNPTNPLRLSNFVAPAVGGGYALAFGDALSAPAQYVAFASSAARSPLSITRDASPSDLRSSANGADEIIISADDFYTATAALADYRATQGLRVMRVRISDVYDEFSDGVFDPTAIRAFLAYAYANWQQPAPLYVLLVGDGNLNYRNYQPNNMGAIEPQYIPPYLDAIDPILNETATDNRFVNIVGNDLAPDMAIGRLPVRSVPETTSIINKIIAFEQGATTDAWRKRVDFFTDNYYTSVGGTDAAGDFYSTAEEIRATIPGQYTVTRAYYDPAPMPPNPGYTWHYPTVVDTRNALMTALNTGALFVNYVGHATQNQWAGEALYANAGAAPNPDLFSQLANGSRTPIVLELTCKTGMFHLPGTTSLAEDFIRSNGRGAVADWASTGLGVNEGHNRLARGFYTAVFTSGVPTLGLAINASKASMVADGAYLDLVDEFTLFGDPAMRMSAMRPTQLYLPLIAR